MSGQLVCPVHWCTRWHGEGHEGGGRRTHVLELGPFPGPDLSVSWESLPSRITLIQIDEGDEQGTPVVRIEFSVYGQARVMEVSTALASDLGDLLTALSGATHRAFAGALVATFWLTGGGV